MKRTTALKYSLRSGAAKQQPGHSRRQALQPLTTRHRTSRKGIRYPRPGSSLFLYTAATYAQPVAPLSPQAPAAQAAHGGTSSITKFPRRERPAAASPTTRPTRVHRPAATSSAGPAAQHRIRNVHRPSAAARPPISADSRASRARPPWHACGHAAVPATSRSLASRPSSPS